MAEDHTCSTRGCPLCEQGADTLDLALHVLENTPSHPDMQEVRDQVFAFVERYPAAWLIVPDEEGSIRSWCATYLENAEAEYTQFWVVPVDAHLAKPELVRELRDLADTLSSKNVKRGSPARRRSRILIAQGSHAGAVLDYDGPDISNEVSEAGLYHLEDLGLDDAPRGLSIWEGYYVYREGYVDGYPAPGEGDSTPEGAFRALTDEEWGKFRRGELFL